MANKKTIGTGAAAPVFSLFRQTGVLICCVFFMAQCETNAQKLSKYYVSYSQPAGMMYFIQPQTNFNNTATKEKFISDVTYIDSNDSATINFTFSDKDDLNLKTITVAYGNWQYQSDVQRIYVDMDKKRWRYRYTFQIPFEQLVLFYRAKAPVITLATDSSRNISVKTIKQWKKNAEINNHIMQIIQKNK